MNRFPTGTATHVLPVPELAVARCGQAAGELWMIACASTRRALHTSTEGCTFLTFVTFIKSLLQSRHSIPKCVCDTYTLHRGRVPGHAPCGCQQRGYAASRQYRQGPLAVSTRLVYARGCEECDERLTHEVHNDTYTWRGSRGETLVVRGLKQTSEGGLTCVGHGERTSLRIGRSALDLLEVVPGVTVREVLGTEWPSDFEGNLQIGRTPPLSSNKAATHFPILRRETGIPYDKMLFFDDCNWGDHCGAVAQGCREDASGLGPVTVRTPQGLGPADWNRGLKQYRERREAGK